jgi:prepilin-type N-terminal cleavage/methylation domain-containing protein
MPRSRLRADDGFTLVELVVVVLIVGVLAAVGLATLLNQRGKAQDAEAKTTVVTGAKAVEAYSTEHGGGYADVTLADLGKIEPSLKQARELTVTSTATTYTVSVASAAAAGAAFSIERTAAGDSIRSCTQPGTGGCRAAADAHGNRW